MCGSSSAGRALAFQAMCRGFDSRLPLVEMFIFADVAQSVERVLGKDEVTGSIPVVGPTDYNVEGLLCQETLHN